MAKKLKDWYDVDYLIRLSDTHNTSGLLSMDPGM